VLRRTLSPALALLVAAALTVSTAGSFAAPTDLDAGPPYDYTTELMGQFGPPIPLKNAAMLTKTEHGYLYRSGQQDGHLVVTEVDRGLRFRDTGTQELRELSGACLRQRVKVGIAAVCRVPAGITESQPLLVEVWPRLGDDFTDSSSLPATFALVVLGDEGHDVARLGAGPDFFNGHSGRDRISGGAGNDWIRAGLDNDSISSGPGDDRLVGMEGDDIIYGGDGDDRVGGGPGNDRLRGDAGADFVLCGTGADSVRVDGADALLDCESVDLG
jgi:serralysin